MKLGLSIVLCSTFGVVSALAQSRMTGTVSDSSGAIVVGANFTARNVETGITTSAESSQSGVYIISFLNPGKFGLGEAEWALFDRMREQIPSKYRVVPIYARHVLLYNSGIHCVSGLVRKPAP